MFAEFYFHVPAFTFSSGGGQVVRWCWVNLKVPGRPAGLDKSRARACCACSRCGWAWFGHFFLSSIISHFFLPLSGRRLEIECNIVSKGVKPKTTNQPFSGEETLSFSILPSFSVRISECAPLGKNVFSELVYYRCKLIGFLNYI